MFEFEEAVDLLVKKKLIKSKFVKDIPIRFRKMSFFIAGVNDLNLLDQVLFDLQKSVKEGTTFNSWKKNLDKTSLKDLAIAPLKTIFRTNMATAYNEGIKVRAQETKHLIPYFRYVAIQDDRLRDSHGALHDIVRPVDDPIWDSSTPPLGYNCRCTIQQLTKTQAQRFTGKKNPVTGKSKAKQLFRKNRDKGFGTRQSSSKNLEKYLQSKTKGKPAAFKREIKKIIKDSDRKSKKWFAKNEDKFRIT